MSEEGKPGEVLLINKPVGWSSFQAVKKVKFITHAKKVGHAGTLDPLASGLLIMCTEKCTKKIQDIQSQEKEYTGTFVFGATTPSHDMETEPNAQFPFSHINKTLIDSVLPSFIGKIKQTPPLYSAIKVDGKRAYELARKGVEHTLNEREVEIKEFEIVEINLPEIQFRVVCSKGTYIRSLANDLGLALKSGAYLKSLVRTRIGDFLLANALTPEELQMLRNPSNLNEKKTV